MFGNVSNIFKKTIKSKAFWMGLLLCLTFSIAIPSPVAAEYDCPGTDVLKERYMGDCFPCQIVNVLLASFMRAAGKVYDVSKEAGNKLLFIGAVLWLAFWALKKMASMSNVEPASMSNELVVFFGKVVVAYCFINAGIGTLVNYAVNPILGAGADWGTALLLESKNMEINSAPKQENTYKGPTEIVDKSTMDKILKLSEGVSNEVAMNLVIGNALTCYSVKKGIHFKLPGIIEIHIPDIWLWLVGAAIWCAGFMLVLSVCYYLIDIPFKIGFAIIALPVVIGLWPFKITAGKLKDVVMVAFNAAGTFLFLALSSSYAMRLISQSFSTVGSIPGGDNNSLSGADALLTVMNGELDKDNMQYVENVFSITGGSFLIIMFCYIYGIKMISQVTNSFPNKFFGEGIVAGVGSPLHHMATAATMWASKKAAAPFKMAGDIVAHQAGKAATTAAKAAGNVGLGIAGAAAGSVTRSIGRRAQNFGQRMAEKAKKNKEGWDSLDRYDSLNQSGMRATIGNKLGKLGARAQVGLANTIAKTGEHLDTAGQYMAAPGERTFNRVRNAWSQGTSEIGDAAAELADTVTASGKYSAQQMKEQAHKEFSGATAKLGESGKKLATYIPGSGVAAPEGTLRHAFASLGKEKIKNAFSWKTIKGRIYAGASSYAKNIKDDAKADWADITDSSRNLADNVMHMGKHMQGDLSAAWENIKNSEQAINAGYANGANDIISAAGELKKSAADLGRTLAGEHALNHAKGTSTLNQFGTGASAVVGTSGALQFGSGLGTMGIGAVAGRHLYNNTKEAVEETMAAWKEGKIDDLFDLAGAVAHPFMAVPRILTNTASQTVESTYQIAEKTMLAGIDVALTAVSPFKSIGNDVVHRVNQIGNIAQGIASIPTRAVIVPVLNAGEIGIKGVRMVTRATANAVLPLAFAPVGFAAKAVDETLYAAYKMTVRPAAAVGTAAVRGAKVLYKGAELGVKSTKVGRGTIRTFKAGGKTLKVGVKTLKLGRDMIRAAAGEGGYSNDPKTREEKEQLRKERKMRRQAELEKERKKQEAREREEQEAQRRSEEFRNRHEQEEAQRRAEEEAARQAAQVEAERRDAAEAASIQTEEDAAPDHHQTLTDAINNEEIESTKNYSKDDLQKILDTHEQLLNGTGNGTAFESLHENSVSDLQKFAEGKVTIDKDSYATMVPFIKTFGTDDKGQLTDVGRAAQTKLTSLITGGSSGGSPSGGNT